MNKHRLAADFVSQATRIWGNRYDYSESHQTLKHFYAKVAILCLSHGRFFLSPKDHLRGVGCLQCDRKDARHAEQWQQRAALARTESLERLLPENARIYPVES